LLRILIVCSRASILGKFVISFLYLNSGMRQRNHSFKKFNNINLWLILVQSRIQL